MRVLAFVAPGDLMANTPVEFLLEESEATLDLYYVVPGRPVSQLLPDHDVAFVAIGASDENLPILQQLARLTRCWPVPVLNAPERIVRLSREFVWAHLTCAPGITMPMTARVERQTLAQIGAGAVRVGSVLERGDFPIIVRPVGSHAGQSLARLDDAAGIATYLQGQQESRFHVSRFIDYRGLDGLFRTYRIVFVADRPLPCHMTISESWMVNDPNAGTNADAETRAEDAHFRASFDDVFARRHGAAFRAITERLGLDYFGFDCAETPRGDLLIFEVSTTISGQSMDPLHLYPCTQPQMRKVADAFREMLRATRRASLR